MNKIEFNQKKTLKLMNVLCYRIQLQSEETSIDVQLEQMQTYIRTKGAVQIGPLIQYISPQINEQGEVDVQITFLLQCNHEIHNVEQPYTMQNVLRIPNCLYCRYTGPETTLKFAYDKINLYAFENDIKLKGDSYTVFIDNKEENDDITADVFMERANDETD